MEKNNTPIYGIRGKLISAVCMLLVAVVMVVSSTYAWFTLSTAPEVTGITTTVGSNGALEMLLATKDGNGWVYNEGVLQSESWEVKNTYWGNLVDLSNDEFYGIGNLKLYPSTIKVENGKINGGAPLMIPVYGNDGRVSGFVANTSVGAYDKESENFYVNDGYGIRAVGVASGMTERQYAYRNFKVSADTNMATAQLRAQQSLSRNGGTLANVALKKATNADATYTADDIAAVKAIVGDLLGTEGVIALIENAYLDYVCAYAASDAVQGDGDLAYSAVESYFGGDITKLYDAVAEGEDQGKITVEIAESTSFTVTVPSELYTPLNALKATKTAVETADAKLDALAAAAEGGAEIKWATGATYNESAIGLGNALSALADVDNLKINGIPAGEAKERMNEIAQSAMGGGLKVTMASGAGVYADVADHCGNYSVSIVIEEVSYGGLTLENTNAAMETRSTVSPAYLAAVKAVVDAAGAPVGAAAAEAPFTEFYGYIVDLAFKTNASNSKLLLEIDGADRIYDDNTNTDTLGAGSKMTFAKAETATDMTDDQVRALMTAARIVFYNTETNDVYAYAKLDVAHAVDTVGGLEARIVVYEEFEGMKAEDNTVYGIDADGNLVTLGADGMPTATVAYYAVEETEGDVTKTVYYATKDETTIPAEGEGEDTVEVSYSNKFEGKLTKTNVTVFFDEDSCEIRDLEANQEAHVSALVYLDGNYITNSDVTAIGDTSVTMKMNLQFKSNATLVPMTDGNLYQPADNGGSQGGVETEAETEANG